MPVYLEEVKEMWCVEIQSVGFLVIGSFVMNPSAFAHTQSPHCRVNPTVNQLQVFFQVWIRYLGAPRVLLFGKWSHLLIFPEFFLIEEDVSSLRIGAWSDRSDNWWFLSHWGSLFMDIRSFMDPCLLDRWESMDICHYARWWWAPWMYFDYGLCVRVRVWIVRVEFYLVCSLRLALCCLIWVWHAIFLKG